MDNTEARALLYKLVKGWDKLQKDKRDYVGYELILDELDYQQAIRFGSITQWRNDGPFFVRLHKWISNGRTDGQKQLLLRLLAHVSFVDELQLTALYKDAFRRVLVPYLCRGDMGVEALLSPTFDTDVRFKLREFFLCSITTSFSGEQFLKLNDLAGIGKIAVLGEIPEQVGAFMRSNVGSKTTVVIFEDVVFTGNQAGGILHAIRGAMPHKTEIIFIPLIILQDGLTQLVTDLSESNVEIHPVLTLGSSHRIKPTPETNEPSLFPYVRSLLSATKGRVLEPNGPLDAMPRSEYGYKDTGALIVTSHNTPNNTVPILHHKAPDWEPIFRRLHH